MNIQHNDKLRDQLSAAYVLGTLKGAARRRFEAYMKESALIQREVGEWQDRLNPMAELAGAVKPPARVWNAIEQRIKGTESRWAFWINLHNDLAFWRGLGLVSTTAACILVAFLATRAPEPTQTAATAYVAMLSDDKAQPVIVITGDANKHQLVARLVSHPTVEPGKSLELWAVPQKGNPRSLGLVSADGSVTLPLPDFATPGSAPVLAVSLEPKGGSPNPNGPTGPILFKGAWVQI
ncbi:MAG TPA: anti-sigma factor [Burkholderiaceae bacterium]